MVKKKMYQKINKLKKRGKSKTEIASELSLDPATVRKYYQMVPDAYIHYQEQLTERKKLFESFIDEIKKIYELNDSRNLNMAAVYDYLEEKYSNPEIEITLGHKIEYYALKSFVWVRDQVTHVVTKAISMAIPKWVWFALVGAVILTLVLIWYIQ